MEQVRTAPHLRPEYRDARKPRIGGRLRTDQSGVQWCQQGSQLMSLCVGVWPVIRQHTLAHVVGRICGPV